MGGPFNRRIGPNRHSFVAQEFWRSGAVRQFGVRRSSKRTYRRRPQQLIGARRVEPGISPLRPQTPPYHKVFSIDAIETQLDTFTPRLRSRAFGVRRSHLACQRLKEAVTEIQKLSKVDPVTAGDGVVSL